MDLDLNNIIKIQKLTDDQVKFIIYQIMRGLKYIHSAGIIHRLDLFLILGFSSFNKMLSVLLYCAFL